MLSNKSIISFTLICWLLLLPSISHGSAKPLNDVPYSSLAKLPQGKPSQIISYGDSHLQYGQLWLPTDQDKNKDKPLLVLIHGGCWINAYDIKHTQGASYALSQAGYAVWSLEYRRTGDQWGGWPGTYHDVLKGIEHSKQIAKTFKLNSNNLVLMGHSAGGHLALLAGKHFANNKSTQIKAVVGLAPIVDIEQYSKGDNSCQDITSRFMDGTYAEKPKQYDLANPMKQGFHPNSILIHGDIDPIVPLAQSSNSKQKVKVVKGAGHFDMLHSGTTAWQTIMATLESL